MRKLIGMLMLSTVFLAAPISAYAGEGPSFSVGTDQGFYNKYVWRGINATDDWVWQPDIWASYAGLTFSVWGNMDLTDVNGEEGNFTEVDYALDYTHEFDKLSVSAGGIVYHFPQLEGDCATTELYVGVAYDIITQPTLKVYYDVDDADGFYASLGMGHSFSLFESGPVAVGLDLSASAGWASKNWNNFYYGADHSTVVDLLAGAALPVGIYDNFTVKPAVSYSTVMDSVLRSKADNDHEWIMGVTLSAEI